jgi:hypothetical protein
MCRNTIIRSLIVGFLLIPFATVTAQDNTASEGARLQLINLFYADANVFVDDSLSIDSLGFPFDSEVLPIPAGPHTVAVADTTDDPGAGGTVDLDVVAGHDYLVVAYGNNEIPTLLAVDLSEAFAGMDESGQRALFLHTVNIPLAADAYIDDQLVAEGVGYGEYAAFEVPLGVFTAKITPNGAPDITVMSLEYVGIPQSVSIVIVGGTLNNIWQFLFTTTELNIVDYLAHEQQTSGWLNKTPVLLAATGLTEELAGEGPFTFFVPSDKALEALPAEVLADPVQMADILRANIVPGYWPANLLKDVDSLTNLLGEKLVVTHPENDFWKINDTVSFYLQQRVSNGIIYSIVNDGLIMPAD